MIGLGTAINVVAILVGSAIGVALGHRLPHRTRDVVTDGLGLITLLVAALSAASLLDAAVAPAVGSAGVLIVLGSLMLGGIGGSLLRIEDRLEGLGEAIRRRLAPRRPVRADLQGPAGSAADVATPLPGGSTQDSTVDVEVDGSLADPDPTQTEPGTFVEGFVTASLVFCVGPLTILGSLSDGLGLGIDQLALKSTLDGFASIAFAAALGWGVAASVITVAVVQGGLTIAGWALGSVLGPAQIALLTATGGLLLVGIALRLLRIRHIPVADMLPALLIAPLATALVTALG